MGKDKLTFDEPIGGIGLIEKLEKLGYCPQKSWTFERMKEKFKGKDNYQVIVVPHLKIVDIEPKGYKQEDDCDDT